MIFSYRLERQAESFQGEIFLDRDEILHIIDSVYTARKAGDKEAVAAYWAPDAIFRLAGEASLMSAVVPAGTGGAKDAVDALIDRFQFHELERLSAVVEGNMAAIHWRVTFSTAGCAPLTTEISDLWTIGEDGKAVSLLQFTDTALLWSQLDRARE